MLEPETFRFEYEWLDAPGVGIESHRKTWCRLVVRIGETSVTEVHDRRTKSVRPSIYGTAMSLAEWVVSRWWFLFEEAEIRFVDAGMRKAVSERTLAWHHRHNLLSARRGGALPDLSIARATKDLLIAMWHADYDERVSIDMPVVFGGKGRAYLDRAQVEDELSRFCEAVVARLDGCESADARELRSSWAALCALEADDRLLRTRAAMLGLDGDDAEQVDDAAAATLVYGLGQLDADVVADVLDAARTPESARETAEWVAVVRDMALPEASAIALGDAARRLARLGESHGRSYLLGWQMAQMLRSDVLGTHDAVVGRDLDALLADRALIPNMMSEWAAEKDIAHVRGWLGSDEHIARFALRRSGLASARRFGVAHLLGLGLQGRKTALATDANSHVQRVARAFAAELLAPRSWIAARVQDDIVPSSQADAWASELEVDPRVVEHQIENHRLATIEYD